jgi:hypothetical protein
MAYSKIVLTFTDNGADGDRIEFYRYNLGNPASNGQIWEEWYTEGRLSNFMMPITGNLLFPPGVMQAIRFQLYFQSDWGTYFTVTRISNVVTLTLRVNEWGINNVVNTVTGMTYVVTNQAAPTFFLTSAIETPEIGNECNRTELTVIATDNIVKYWVNRTPYTVTPNTTIVIQLVRGIRHTIEIEDAFGKRIYLGVYEQDTLTAEQITVGVSQYLTGATLTVYVADADSLTLEYSIDNILWWGTNVFTGQIDVIDATMWVRDQWGCVKSVFYTIDEFGTRAPFLYISDTNSVSFKEQVDVNELTVFRNDINTLAHQELPDVKYCETLKFMTGDNTRIQIKSNYTTIIATLRKEDGTEVELAIAEDMLMSNNLNRYARMDAKYYEYNSRYTGIYFENGFYYSELDVQGDSYNLAGNLPDFAVIGNQVTIVGGLGTFEIKDIVYDTVLKKKAILIDLIYPGVGVEDIKVESIYDLLPFEIYEFDVNWSTYGEGLYDLMIENTNDTETVIHLSENIHIKDLHDKTFAIRYFNENNRDIFYKYEIE